MGRNVSLLILFDHKKRILLQHRSEDAKRIPGYWGFFGGGIEDGESPDQALDRELQEELDYSPRKPRLVMEQQFQHSTKYIYMEEYDSSTKLTLLEGQGMDWFTLDETKDLQMIDDDRKIIEYIKGKY